MKLPPPIPGDVEFFRAFARLEQVLKAWGFLMPPRTGGRNDVAPDWDGFIAKNPALHTLQCDPNPAIKYLVNSPPWHQIVNSGGVLDYEEPGPVRTAQELMGAVRRVRNNLFHGEKTSSGPMNDPERNRLLIAGGTAVLEEILRRCPNIEKIFDRYDW